VNALRGTSLAADRAKKTHCVRGHSLSGSNLYLYRGHRQCEMCRRMRLKSWWRDNRKECNSKAAAYRANNPERVERWNAARRAKRSATV
jgi:hypothetical protein